MKRTKLMWIVVGVVAGSACFLSGLGIGAGLGSNGDYSSGFNKAIEQTKTTLSNKGIVPPTPAQITIISGMVKSVGDNKISLAVNRVTANPLEDQGPLERTISIDKNTKIFSMIPLTSAEMSAAASAFQDGLKDGKAPTPPSPFKEQIAKLSDIKEGKRITVQSKTDIRFAEKITAEKITFDSTMNQ